MDKNYPDILDVCKEWLSSNGFRYEVDQDGDISFKYQMLNMFIAWSDEDPGFLRIILPAIWSIDNEAESQNVMKVCDKLNMQRKALKAFTTTNNTFLSVELLIQPDFNPAAILERSLEILLQGYHLFAQEMRALQN